MYASKTHSRRGLAAAAALLLTLTLLLSACSKNKDTASDPSAQIISTAPDASTSERVEPQESTQAAPESTAAVETEPAPPETAPATAPWEPGLNRTDISFFGPGENFVLVVTGVPADAEIVWRSENEAIAAVDEVGRVTAVAPGSVRIYASVGGKEVFCWIRCQFEAVTEENAPALDKTDMSFFGAGEFYRLTVVNAPEDAEILWTSEDYSVATVDETGKVTAVGPGTIKVKAEVGSYVLSCWVRCQFAAPEKPRSSVADGTWLVRMTKGGVKALNEAAGDYAVDADLLVQVRVVRDYLEGLDAGSDLNLSAYGYGILRVESVNFSGSTCTVTTGGSDLKFQLDDSGKWTLLDEDGEPAYYKSGSARLIFDANSVCLDQMSAVIAGQTSPVHRDRVTDFFDQVTGYENELPRVSVTVADGVVTQAIWNFHR